MSNNFNFGGQGGFQHGM
jgi:hypothetical protein